MNRSKWQRVIIRRGRAQVWAALALAVWAVAANAGVPVQHGVASWHNPSKGDARTAGDRPWTGAEMIAAHRTLPLGSKVRVVNLANGRSVVVEIRDRGPYRRGRIIDVSRGAARELGLLTAGTARVRLEPADEANPSL